MTDVGKITSEIASAPQTFTNWDLCMSKVYCKWPAIIGIVIGGIIVLSIIWCIASCLCCGASLCASCTRCLTCFGCCGLCGNSGGGGSRKQHQDHYAQMPPTPYNGYQAPPTNMSYNQPTSHRGFDTGPPQFATFDDSKGAKNHEDNLPVMPSWATATSRRVEDHSPVEPARGHGDDVEMGRVAPSPQPQQTGAPRGLYSSVPNTGPISPVSPPQHQQPRAYFDSQAQAHPYQSDLGAQRMPHEDQYDDHNNGHNINERYGDNFQNIPMSPAPTYTSQPPAYMIGAAATTSEPSYVSPVSDRDRYGSPVRSVMPAAEDYNRGHLPPQQPQSQQYSGVVGADRSQSPYGHAHSRSQAWSPPVQSNTTASTRYEVTDDGYGAHTYPHSHSNSYSQSNSHSRQQSYGRASSPYGNHNENRYSYEQPQQHSQGARPPSLLQVGRKAVVGSHREV